MEQKIVSTAAQHFLTMAKMIGLPRPFQHSYTSDLTLNLFGVTFELAGPHGGFYVTKIAIRSTRDMQMWNFNALYEAFNKPATVNPLEYLSTEGLIFYIATQILSIATEPHLFGTIRKAFADLVAEYPILLAHYNACVAAADGLAIVEAGQ